MKKFALLSSVLFVACLALAQEDSDTTKLKIGDMKVLMIDESPNDSTSVDTTDTGENSKLELTHWGGVELGINMLMNKDMNTTFEGNDEWLQLDPASSLSWRINLIEEKIRIVKEYVGLIVGAGFTYNSYGFKNNINVISTSDTTYGVEDTLFNYSKNKVRASYVNVPLILEFNTSNNNERCFHVGLGVIGGLRMGSVTKQKYEFAEQEIGAKVKDDFNMNSWNLDLTARIGFRNFTAFATYGLTPLFEDGKGPEVNSMTIGLTLIPW